MTGLIQLAQMTGWSCDQIEAIAKKFGYKIENDVVDDTLESIILDVHDLCDEGADPLQVAETLKVDYAQSYQGGQQYSYEPNCEEAGLAAMDSLSPIVRSAEMQLTALDTRCTDFEETVSDAAVERLAQVPNNIAMSVARKLQEIERGRKDSAIPSAVDGGMAAAFSSFRKPTYRTAPALRRIGSSNTRFLSSGEYAGS